MSSTAKRTAHNTIFKRLSGSRPGPLAAFVTAVIVGIAAAVATYRCCVAGNRRESVGRAPAPATRKPEWLETRFDLGRLSQ
jgi:hypothetical protein